MTTNKPEVVVKRYAPPACSGWIAMMREDELGEWVLAEHYEALQAEREKLRKHLQHMIDQTTPLEPEPGNPMWSRRIQLDEVIAERDQLRAECEQLRKDAARYGWLMQDHHEWPEKVERAIKYQNKSQIDAAMQGGQP